MPRQVSSAVHSSLQLWIESKFVNEYLFAFFAVLNRRPQAAAASSHSPSARPLYVNWYVTTSTAEDAVEVVVMVVVMVVVVVAVVVVMVVLVAVVLVRDGGAGVDTSVGARVGASVGGAGVGATVVGSAAVGTILVKLCESSPFESLPPSSPRSSMPLHFKSPLLVK